MTESNRISRRRVLTVAVGVAGAATGAAIIGTTTPAYAKVAAEGREVSGHAEGRSGMRKLLAVRSAVFLQDRRWNRVASRLVHGLCEEARLDFKKYISARFRTGY